MPWEENERKKQGTVYALHVPRDLFNPAFHLSYGQQTTGYKTPTQLLNIRDMGRGSYRIS